MQKCLYIFTRSSLFRCVFRYGFWKNRWRWFRVEHTQGRHRGHCAAIVGARLVVANGALWQRRAFLDGRRSAKRCGTGFLLRRQLLSGRFFIGEAVINGRVRPYLTTAFCPVRLSNYFRINKHIHTYA